MAALEKEIQVDLIPPTVPGRQALQEIGDTVEVQSRTPMPKEQEPVTEEMAGDLRSASEVTAERQSRSGRASGLPQRYQVQQATASSETATP